MNGQKPGFRRDGSWSKMENTGNNKLDQEYLEYQKAIDAIIEEKSININRIQFDYKYWSEARNIHEKKDIRIGELKEIWGIG